MEQLLALRDSEGLSLRCLSDQSGVPVGTLSWWSHRLRQEARPGFTEVQIGRDHVTTMEPSAAPEIVVRHPDGVAVELRGVAADRVVAHMLARIDGWC
jgi:hypothetical protein